MYFSQFTRFTVLPLLFLLIFPCVAVSQDMQNRTDNSSEQLDGLTAGPLFEELAKLDKKLFDAAFVSCNTEIRNSLFTEDVEFYHDIGGLSIGEAVRVPITNCPADRGVTRRLVEGSLEVYPLNNYGAIQRGKHLFIEEGASNMTIARFTHIWMESEDGWKISRVLSFNHQQIPRSE